MLDYLIATNTDARIMYVIVFLYLESTVNIFLSLPSLNDA